MTDKRFTSVAGKLDVFFRILGRILLACAIAEICVMIVLSIANAVNPATVIGTKLNELDLGPVTFELAGAYTPDNASILKYAWACAVPDTAAAVIAYIALDFVRKILSPMKEGLPFHRDAARCLKRIAVLSLVLGIIRNIGGMVETWYGFRAFGLDSFAGEGFLTAIRADYSWDFSYIVVFFVLLLMSYIFSYGAQLQQLSDETL